MVEAEEAIALPMGRRAERLRVEGALPEDLGRSPPAGLVPRPGRENDEVDASCSCAAVLERKLPYEVPVKSLKEPGWLMCGEPGQ